jgi:hypothetical protein
MGVQFKQVPDGGLGLEGVDAGDGGFINVTANYTASAVDQTVFTADRTYIVKAIRGRVDVAGTGGAATCTVRKAASGTAITSGTALHSGSYNLVGTANAQQTLTLSTTASDLIIPAGTSICLDYTGTLTSAVGNITITLSPA